MTETTSPTIDHDAHLGTGNGLVQFVCCRRTQRPFDALWVAPGGDGAVNVWHSPRESYETIVKHLTQGYEGDPTVGTVLDAAEALISQVDRPEPWRKPQDDVRAAIEHLAERLGTVHLEIDDR